MMARQPPVIGAVSHGKTCLGGQQYILAAVFKHCHGGTVVKFSAHHRVDSFSFTSYKNGTIIKWTVQSFAWLFCSYLGQASITEKGTTMFIQLICNN